VFPLVSLEVKLVTGKPAFSIFDQFENGHIFFFLAMEKVFFFFFFSRNDKHCGFPAESNGMKF
jgi:hypothetical protein